MTMDPKTMNPMTGWLASAQTRQARSPALERAPSSALSRSHSSAPPSAPSLPPPRARLSRWPAGLMLCAGLALTVPALAAAPAASTPSEASLERLLVVTQAERLTESTVAQVHASMKPMMAQVLNSKDLSPQRREQADRLMARFIDRMNNILADELSWARMKDFNLQIYRETFTQQEVDELIRFYESPTGQAFVSKMPVVMAKSLALMQQRMLPMNERLQAAAQDTLAEFKRDETPPEPALPPPAPGPTRARARAASAP